ncbi:MAG: hypothetical protein U0736_26075 [Gemmataceae bacterium]
MACRWRGWSASATASARNNIGHWMTRTHRLLGRILNGFTRHDRQL